MLLRRAELHGASYTPSSLRRQEERGWVMTACGGGWERVRQTSKKWPVLVTQVALHSEGVGSKWSTVGVIETQAMADAVLHITNGPTEGPLLRWEPSWPAVGENGAQPPWYPPPAQAE